MGQAFRSEPLVKSTGAAAAIAAGSERLFLDPMDDVDPDRFDDSNLRHEEDEMNIESLAAWGEPKRINTRQARSYFGSRLVRRNFAPPGERTRMGAEPPGSGGRRIISPASSPGG